MDNLTPKEEKVLNNLSRVLSPSVSLGDKIEDAIDLMNETAIVEEDLIEIQTDLDDVLINTNTIIINTETIIDNITTVLVNTNTTIDVVNTLIGVDITSDVSDLNAIIDTPDIVILDGDATVSDVLSGKTFYNNDPYLKLVGTMVIEDVNLIASNIKKGVTIFGVLGTMNEDPSLFSSPIIRRYISWMSETFQYEYVKLAIPIGVSLNYFDILTFDGVTNETVISGLTSDEVYSVTVTGLTGANVIYNTTNLYYFTNLTVYDEPGFMFATAVKPIPGGFAIYNDTSLVFPDTAYPETDVVIHVNLYRPTI